jgi:hypothetical protein
MGVASGGKVCRDVWWRLCQSLLCVPATCARYYEQYGLCVLCPTVDHGASLAASVGFPILLALGAGLFFLLRGMMPRGLMKVRPGSYPL